MMDSIINNTSFAFIQSLGYDIKDYTNGNTSAMPNGNTYSPCIVPAFTKAFIDVVTMVNNIISAWTLRPCLCRITDTAMTAMYTTWGVCTFGSSVYSYISHAPWASTNSDFPAYFCVRNSTTISFHKTATSGTSTIMTYFFYVVE